MYKISTMVTMILMLSFSASAWGAKSKWKKLEIVDKNIEKSVISSIIKKEVKLQGKPLLPHKYLLRIEILGGGGPKRTSETVFHFKNIAKFMVVKSVSDLSKRSAVTFSGYKDCPWSAVKKRNYCPGAGIAGEGSFDMTSKMKKKTILVVSRSKKGYKAKTIIWIAYDKPQKKILYFQFSDKQFGLDSLKSILFTVNPDKSPDLPPVPSDVLDPSVVDKTPDPVTKPGVTPVKPVKPTKPIVKPVIKRRIPKGFFPLKLLKFSNTLLRIFKNDFIDRLYFQGKTEYLNWARIQVSKIDYREDAGGFKLLFSKRPVKLYIYAWTDKRNIKLTSVGDLKSCKAKGIKGCPYRIDGSKWYDFSRYIKGKSVVVRSFPRRIRKGHFILWAAFRKPVGKIRYYRPGFKGGISVYYKNGKRRPTRKGNDSWL